MALIPLMRGSALVPEVRTGFTDAVRGYLTGRQAAQNRELTSQRLQDLAEDRASRAEDRAFTRQYRQEAAKLGPDATIRDRASLIARFGTPSEALAADVAVAGLEDKLFDRAYKTALLDIERGKAGTAGQTAAEKNYNIAVDQGYQGSFFDYQQDLKRAGVPQPESTFATEGAKIRAKRYGKVAEAGSTAQEELAGVQQLRDIFRDTPTGAATALRGWAAEYGIPIGEDASDIQAAQAIISRLVPRQRVPGSGATSDFEGRQFARAVPRLLNQPGANQIVLDTMEALLRWRIQQADIANRALSGEISEEEARVEAGQIADPWTEWKEFKKTMPGTLPSTTNAAGKTENRVPQGRQGFRTSGGATIRPM